jgi:uncharacterized protein (DUF1684 family)
MRQQLFLFAMVCAGVLPAQDDAAWRDSLSAYWVRIEAGFREPDRSPLTPDDRARFTGLERYAPDTRFRIKARFRAKEGAPFGMRTTTDRTPEYVAVGVLHFKLLGVKERLTVYRNIDPGRKPGYEQHLFVPFTDLTNGEGTYGGGRYLDLIAPLGREVEIDLNRAYNPYCAYGGRYSCPVPPLENHLQIRVEAGVKAFQGH